MLRVIINDSIINISCQAIVVGLKELVIARMLDHVGSSKAVGVPLPGHIADHQAAAVGRPVAIHQLDVVSPAGVHVWPGVLGGETASQTNVCEAHHTYTL